MRLFDSIEKVNIRSCPKPIILTPIMCRRLPQCHTITLSPVPGTRLFRPNNAAVRRRRHSNSIDCRSACADSRSLRLSSFPERLPITALGCHQRVIAGVGGGGGSHYRQRLMTRQ